jgi:hypothetical protein
MGLGAFLLAFAASASPDLIPVAQTEDGFVFYIRTGSIVRHPLGHTVRVHGRGTKPRPLVRANPLSPKFLSIESTWVVKCHEGTYSIIDDSFYDKAGVRVAHFTGHADEQQQPVAGSISYQLLQAVCKKAAVKRVVAFQLATE